MFSKSKHIPTMNNFKKNNEIYNSNEIYTVKLRKERITLTFLNRVQKINKNID